MLIAEIFGLIFSFLGGILITKKLLSSAFQNITERWKRIKKNGLNERVPYEKIMMSLQNYHFSLTRDG